MIKQGIVNDNILEKKFKILRTSILLGNIKDKETTLTKYERSAREVDSIKRNSYEELLASKLYTTNTLEEEQERLKDLITFIENRIQERNDFIDDYLKVTNNFLDNLPKVSKEEELPSYKIRLDNISEYLNNCHGIERETENLKKYRDELEEKYENKANNEIINSKLEDELIDEFNKIIRNDEYYNNLNYLDIDNEIIKLDAGINEKSDIMNTFISSYEALVNAGISGSEREEYLSYVIDSKVDYYTDLEKKYLLNIYKLVLDKQSNYDLLYKKRVRLNDLLKERNQKREELNITSRDKIAYFINLCNEQFSVIKSQKYNIENIDKLINAISESENNLEKLQKANERKEILDLLTEYGIKTSEVEKIEIPQEQEIHDALVGDSIKIIPKADNMVVKVSEPININVQEACDTARLVMKKVVIVLEPKKFNRKKDKLKETEEPTEKEAEKTIDIDFNNNQNDIFTDNPVTEIDPKELNNFETKHFENDIFTEIKNDNLKSDIFSDIDPFTDNKNETETIMASMPQIDTIGTVKPTNIFSKMEDVAKENDDIILPSMGLSNNDENIPIVSENYIN